MKQRIFYTELAYLIGLVFIALGVSMLEAADFGVSMVVAPAYIFYLKFSDTFSFFTFGMAEYCLQAVLLVVMVIILRKFRVSYLLSFVTAVIYGFILDGCMLLTALLPTTAFLSRILLFIAGALFSASGVSLMFHTYLSPEVYELFVKEVSAKMGIKIHRFKTCYDCVSLTISVILSFAFFGLLHFEGVKIGTIICALFNGWCIGRFSLFYEKHWTFRDALPWRPVFDDRQPSVS